MKSSSLSFILGSRSPRRRELLSYLVPEENITLMPPCSSEEKNFEGIIKWEEILNQAIEISEDKMEDVSGQVSEREEFSKALLLTADTVVVVQEDEPEKYSVLGQPPEGDGWQSVVREWFQKYYLVKNHYAVTAFTLQHSDGQRITQTVSTTVRFRSDSLDYLDWYLSTGESVGKAGGYGIQGKGTIFVDRLEGSLSNVIGLPLTELSRAIDQICS